MSLMTGGADNDAHGELAPAGPPQTLRWNLWATAVWCALSVLSSVLLFGQRPYLRKSLIDQNAKAKKPVADYTAAKVNSDIHSQLLGGLIEALLVSVILLLLAGLVWRGRPWARWVLLALAVAGLPLRVGVVAQLVVGAFPSSIPGSYRAALIASGLAALQVIVLLLHRNTRQYFSALRATQRGTLPAVPGSRLASPRPAGGGLGALFAPRRRPGPAAQTEQVGGADPTASSDQFGATAGVTSDGNTQADESSAATASRRPSATRPGSVKAKGGGSRPGRFKSRQQ